MYSAILVLLAHLDDVTERWDDVDVDASEIRSELTRRDRRSFGMTLMK